MREEGEGEEEGKDEQEKDKMQEMKKEARATVARGPNVKF